MTDKTAGVGPVERGVRWLAGWYATRLHAVPEDQAQATKDARQALCGAWVYGQARTEWAEKRVAAGLKTCGHCKRRLLPPNTELSGGASAPSKEERSDD